MKTPPIFFIHVFRPRLKGILIYQISKKIIKEWPGVKKTPGYFLLTYVQMLSVLSFVEPQSAVKAVRKYCSAVFYINELFGEHCTLSVENRNEKKETKMRESGPTD